jgi:hypothetical protein
MTANTKFLFEQENAEAIFCYLYSEGVRFESWLGHLFSRDFSLFFSPSSKLWNILSLSNPFKFIIHQSSPKSTLYGPDTYR